MTALRGMEAAGAAFVAAVWADCSLESSAVSASLADIDIDTVAAVAAFVEFSFVAFATAEFVEAELVETAAFVDTAVAVAAAAVAAAVATAQLG